MNGKYMLDTSVIIELFKNNPAITAWLASDPTVFIPSIAIGELVYGALHSTQVDRHMEEVRAFVKASTILSCGINTAFIYGQLKQNLRIKGQAIPENDLWIAAIAQEHGLTVAKRDQHFTAIDGLAVELW